MLRRLKRPGALCVLLLLGATYFGGWQTAVIAVALAAYTIVFGGDNAIVVAPYVKRLGRWLNLYRSIGLVVAMVVLILGPTLIASFATRTSPVKLLGESLTESAAFGTALESIHPELIAFAGPFFLLTSVWHFAEGSENPWLRPEVSMKRHGHVSRIVALVVTGLSIGVGTVSHGTTFVMAGIAGAVFFLLLDFGKKKFIKDDGGRPVERAAEAVRLFLIIEGIECALSFDTVVGAMAMSTSIIAVLVGLTMGILLVRTAVVHAIQADKLDSIPYLESGAHWSMGVLGALMLLTPWGIDTPAWFEELSGGGVVAVAVIHSVLRNRRTA